MTQKFFSTFPVGFEELIENVIKRVLVEAKIESMEEGLVVYATSTPLDEIRKLPFFANTFVLMVERMIPPIESVEPVVEALFKQSRLLSVQDIVRHMRAKSFRIYVSKENQTVAVRKKTLTKFEEILEKVLRLRVNRALPDVEFWFVIRRTGKSLMGLRISSMAGTKKIKYLPGELRREIAYLLNALAEPLQNDVLLDPFAGSGAIGLEAARSFPYQKIILSDKDPQSVKLIKERTTGMAKIQILHADAVNLKEIPGQSVTRIVTDPPWGMYAQSVQPLSRFYEQMLREFARLLVPDGRLVILTGAREEFERALTVVSVFELLSSVGVLISGKKAGVYLLGVRNG